jgi:hypothetical protein
VLKHEALRGAGFTLPQFIADGFHFSSSFSAHIEQLMAGV